MRQDIGLWEGPSTRVYLGGCDYYPDLGTHRWVDGWMDGWMGEVAVMTAWRWRRCIGQLGGQLLKAVVHMVLLRLIPFLWLHHTCSGNIKKPGVSTEGLGGGW